MVCAYWAQPEHRLYSIHKLLFQHLFSDKQIDLHAIIFRFMHLIHPDARIHMDEVYGSIGMRWLQGYKVDCTPTIRMWYNSETYIIYIIVLPSYTQTPSLKKCKSSLPHTYSFAQQSKWVVGFKPFIFFHQTHPYDEKSIVCGEHFFVFFHTSSVYKFLTFHRVPHKYWLQYKRASFGWS